MKIKEYEEMKDAKLESGNYKGDEFKNLKDFLDYYFVIPKSSIEKMSDKEKKIIQKYRVYFTSDEEPKSQMFFVKKVKKKRFNQEQVEIIKKEHENGSSYRFLSNKYKCSTKTIYEIISGKY